LNAPELFRETRSGSYEVYREHVGPMWAKMLRTIGFDRPWARGEGPYLWDADGVKYLDFMSGWGVFNFGRRHPAIRDALADVLEADLPNWTAFDTPPLAAALATELIRRMPKGLDRVYFCNSGTEATEAAIKFSRVATGRTGMVYLKRGFHGLTTGALAVNGDAAFRAGFEPYMPLGVEVEANDYEGLERAFAADDIGLFIFEPVQGKGVYIPEDGFLTRAQELCRANGALLVCDEVQTGLGRTGKAFGFEWVEDLEPDIVLVSKALSGGYVPVGAMITRAEVHDRMYGSMDQGMRHACTFGMGDMAMAAGLASLRVLEEEDLAANANRMGALIRDGLEEMMPRFEFMTEVRQRGLMIGIEFGEPKSLGLRGAWATTHRISPDLFPQAVVIPLLDDHQILTQVAGHHMDVVKLLPPLNITEQDVEWFLRGFLETMESLHSFPGPVWELMKKLGKHAVAARR
jgi:ornithine--oxo-acid transaminase